MVTSAQENYDYVMALLDLILLDVLPVPVQKRLADRIAEGLRPGVEVEKQIVPLP